MRSLFVVSLPRSLSSISYQAARQALGLAEPPWAGDGEFLNGDRFHHFAAPVEFAYQKFLVPDRAPDAFARLVAMLDRAVAPEGFAYKDVTQPFAVAQWLRARAARGGESLAVLKIIPDLAHIAYSMLELNGWLYPQNASRTTGAVYQGVVDGLLRAERALASIPGETITFAALQEDEGALPAALGRLYPGVALKTAPYMDGAFFESTRAINRRRVKPGFRWLAERIDELRFDIAKSGEAEVRFGAKELGRLWLWRGWSWAEPWGTWNDANEAEIVIPLARPVERELRLELRAVAHIVRGYAPRQRVRVSVKNQLVASAEFNRHEDNAVSIRVPAALLAGDDAAVFAFEFPDAAPVPPNRNHGDPRKLAVALTSAMLSY